MSTIACPHCGVANQLGASFCESCGLALPSPTPTRPRVVGKNDFASTREGMRLQVDELHQLARRAGNAMLTIAVCTAGFAVILGMIIMNARTRPGLELASLKTQTAVMGILAAIFFGLYMWSRKDPLPPAIVGLVLYATLAIVQFVNVASVNNTHQNTSVGHNADAVNPEIGAMVVRLFFVYMFVRAIQAGIRHRKLLRMQMAQGL